jgi:DNA-directed RNA polymerase subunit K/omega
MSESDIELEYDDNLDPDIYLDEDDEKDQNNKFKVNKNKSELDNDDNNNDYINDDDPEDPEDPDDVDDNYDDYDQNYDDEEDEDNLDDSNYHEDNIHYTDNDLDNDSKIQYIVNSEERITSNIITIYEITELIGVRSTQISQGSPIFTEVKNITNPIEMAKKEILDNKCPLYIKRHIGLDKYELWDPNTMIKPKM